VTFVIDENGRIASVIDKPDVGRHATRCSTSLARIQSRALRCTPRRFRQAFLLFLIQPVSQADPAVVRRRAIVWTT